MRRWLVTGAGLVALGAAGLPFSFVVTILVVPVWRWIEADYGIEAIGHSGPAEWCYFFVWTLWVLQGLLVWRFLGRRGGR